MSPPADLDDSGWDPAWDVPEADVRRPGTGHAPPASSWASFFSDCNTSAEAAMRSAGIDPKRCAFALPVCVSCRVELHPQRVTPPLRSASTPPQAVPACESARRQAGGRLACGRAAALLGLRHAPAVLSGPARVCAVPGDLPRQSRRPGPRRCVVQHHRANHAQIRSTNAQICGCSLTRASDARAGCPALSLGARLLLHQ